MRGSEGTGPKGVQGVLDLKRREEGEGSGARAEEGGGASGPLEVHEPGEIEAHFHAGDWEWWELESLAEGAVGAQVLQRLTPDSCRDRRRTTEPPFDDCFRFRSWNYRRFSKIDL